MTAPAANVSGTSNVLPSPLEILQNALPFNGSRGNGWRSHSKSPESHLRPSSHEHRQSAAADRAAGSARSEEACRFPGLPERGLTVVAVGLGASRLADAVPSSALGYLGIVPLAMGLYRARKLFGGNAEVESPVVASALGTFGVAALTLANGADTLGVLLPLFAETADPWTYVLSATVLFAAALWFVLALWISRHPWIRANVARAERWLVPTLLIAVGSYILFNSTSDTVAGEGDWLDSGVVIDANSAPDSKGSFLSSSLG